MDGTLLDKLNLESDQNLTYVYGIETQQLFSNAFEKNPHLRTGRSSEPCALHVPHTRHEIVEDHLGGGRVAVGSPKPTRESIR